MTQAIHRTWKLYSVVLSLPLLLLSSCGQNPLKGTPEWDGKIYQGHYQTGEVVRAQTGEHISAFDPKFGDGVWISEADIACMYFAFVANCKDWGSLHPGCPKMSPDQVKGFIALYEAFRPKKSPKHKGKEDIEAEK